MATYQDLIDAIARVRSATGDSSAWMQGLSAADLALVTSPMTIDSPGLISAVLDKIHAAHAEIFGSAPQDGAAAHAIAVAESSLIQQNSLTAQLDLQVVAAVLNAHTTNAAGRMALDDLQREVESAVIGSPDLDTPAGARELQRYLTGRLREIKTVVETASLDATSKAALAAALASLYQAGASPGLPSPALPPPATPRRGPAEVHDDLTPSASDVTAAAPLPNDWEDDLPLDPPIAAPSAPLPATAPVPQAPTVPMTAMPAVPQLPGLGGIGSPGSGVPLGGLGLPAHPPGSTPELTQEGPAEQAESDRLEEDEPPDEPAPDEHEPDEHEPERPEHETTVQLPSGEIVTAPSPELARVITAAVAGTPVAEAFRQQGITIPAPGSAVTEPVDPNRLAAGDLGVFADRYAVALGNGKALLNNQIQPAESVTGPGFLGWEHPPRPGALSTSAETTEPQSPAPTRPAVTAGPPR